MGGITAVNGHVGVFIQRHAYDYIEALTKKGFVDTVLNFTQDGMPVRMTDNVNNLVYSAAVMYNDEYLVAVICDAVVCRGAIAGPF